jgi:hypothetical protein
MDSRCPARVHNLARNSIGLLVRQAFEPGSLVAVEVFNHGRARTFLAVVARCVAAENGGWNLGCQFNSLLSRDELQFFCECSNDKSSHAR